ncbi:MAG: hypothetical protein ACOX2K_02655 [Bacillota bacterium]|jgi:hypothetical protein
MWWKKSILGSSWITWGSVVRYAIFLSVFHAFYVMISHQAYPVSTCFKIPLGTAGFLIFSAAIEARFGVWEKKGILGSSRIKWSHAIHAMIVNPIAWVFISWIFEKAYPPWFYVVMSLGSAGIIILVAATEMVLRR